MTGRFKLRKEINQWLAEQSLDKKWNELPQKASSTEELFDLVLHNCPYCDFAEMEWRLWARKLTPDKFVDKCVLCRVSPLICHRRFTEKVDSDSPIDLIGILIMLQNNWEDGIDINDGDIDATILLIQMAFESIKETGKISTGLKVEIREWIREMKPIRCEDDF